MCVFVSSAQLPRNAAAAAPKMSSSTIVIAIFGVVCWLLSAATSVFAALQQQENNVFNSIGDDDDDNSIHIVMFGGSAAWTSFAGNTNATFAAPNYVGHDVQRRACALPCRFSAAGTAGVAHADAVLFEAQPLAGYGRRYRTVPFDLPERRVDQLWINFGYEHARYFELYSDPLWLALTDVNVTFAQESSVPMSFVCRWGGVPLLGNVPPSHSRPRDIAFMSTNCGMGGADARTQYVSELMRHIDVDSLGQCLHNRDLPPSMQAPIYSDHGSSMRNKIDIFSSYKFVLALENNNVTDYVTEKLVNALQSGALPIYMGAPNVDEWLPSPDAVLRTDRFESPAALADEIRRLLRDRAAYDAHFRWRSLERWPQHFQSKVDQCAFYDTDCRICEHVRRVRRRRGNRVERAARRRVNAAAGRAIELKGVNGDCHLEVPHRDESELARRALTVAAWIWPRSFGDGLRIVDKNVAGEIVGFNFDVIALDGAPERGFLRLCAGGSCTLGTRAIRADHWTHVAAVFDHSNASLTFYVNGVVDSRHVQVEPFALNFRPLLVGAGSTRDGFVTARWDGLLDDVSVWHTPFSAVDVARLAFRRIADDEPHLYAKFDMNAGENRALGVSEVGHCTFTESSDKPFLRNNFD
jgi:hypothetical protein